MGITKENKKFKRKVKQSYPTNPTGDRNLKNNKFAIDNDTIREKAKKKT